MNQEKIGKFIAENRKNKKNDTIRISRKTRDDRPFNK